VIRCAVSLRPMEQRRFSADESAVFVNISVHPYHPCSSTAAPGGAQQVPSYSLEDLYRLGLRTAERIKIAEEDVAIAERQQDKGFSTLMPRLNTFGDYRSYSRSAPGATPGSTAQPNTVELFNLRLDQSVSLGGREFIAYSMLKENVTKSKFDLTTTREEYLQRIAAFYYEMLRALRQIEIANANVARLTKQRDAAATRLKVGEVTKTTLLRAEAQLSGAESEVVRAKKQV